MSLLSSQNNPGNRKGKAGEERRVEEGRGREAMILLQQNNKGVNERVKWQCEKKCRIMNRNECERKERADG